MLRTLTTNEGKQYNFNYMGNTGLLVSKSEPGEKSTTFNYEKNGKVRELIESTNVITNISYFINGSGIVTVMSRPIDHYTETWINNGSLINIYKSNISLFFPFFGQLLDHLTTLDKLG